MSARRRRSACRLWACNGSPRATPRACPATCWRGGNLLKRSELNEFVALYQGLESSAGADPAAIHLAAQGVGPHRRKPTWSAETDAQAGTGPDGRWRVYDYEELIARDKASLDIFWLRDDSLADSDNLPPPVEIAREIIEDLEAALEQFLLIEADLTGEAAEGARDEP